MENKEHLTPDAGDLSRQTEERLNPEGTSLNENDEKPRPAESEKKTSDTEAEAAEANMEELAEVEAPAPKKKIPGKKSDSKAAKEVSPETAASDKESEQDLEAEELAAEVPEDEPTAPEASEAPEAEAVAPAATEAEAPAPVEKAAPLADEAEIPVPTAPDAEPAPEAEPTAPTAPDAEPAPEAEPTAPTAPDAEPAPEGEPTAPTAPDAEPAPEAEPTAPTAPDAEPAPEGEPSAPTAPDAEPAPEAAPAPEASEADAPAPKAEGEPTAPEAETPAPEADAPAPEASEADAPAPKAEGEPTAPEAETPAPEVKEVAQAEKAREAEKEEDLAEKYSDLSKEELVEVAEALIKEEDVNYIRTHIGYVKAAFRKLIKEESIADFEKRIQEEGDTEEPESGEQPEVAAEVPVDPLTERFDKAFAVYRGKKALFDQAVEQQKQENLAVKERILEDLRSLIESEEELKKTYDLFRDLQEEWRNVGAVPQNAKGTLWNNYHFLVEKFFDKVKINKELKDLDLKKNLEAKTELCEKAEELLLESSITKSFQRLQKLHEAWKETGPVLKDKKDEIWDRFKAATDKLNKRRQEYYDSLRDDQNNNYAAKVVLCEKAELVAATTPASPKQWQQQTNEINELFKMWKTIGFAPKKVNNEVWNRFRASLDAFYRNKKEFFKKYKDIQTENYNQKLNLCMQAEALKESEDWKTTTEELIALQKEWKKVGPVPAKFSDKIWKRFRAACDEFFDKKSDHFSNIGEKQDENLKKKLELIEQVKSHAYTDDNAKNLDVLQDFQRKWMDIGHVPIKQKDKVQNEFRNAIDQQFEVLNISRKAKSTLSFRSKLENIKSSPQSENILYKERNFLTNKINAIQSDIKVWENNIGFFASSKKADILKAEFEDKIEKGKQEIALLEEKLKILRES